MIGIKSNQTDNNYSLLEQKYEANEYYPQALTNTKRSKRLEPHVGRHFISVMNFPNLACSIPLQLGVVAESLQLRRVHWHQPGASVAWVQKKKKRSL